MTFRTILKTSLPFREEWETLVEHGHECSQTDIGIERNRSDRNLKATSKCRKKQRDRKETEKRREGRILWGRRQRLGARRRAQWRGRAA